MRYLVCATSAIPRGEKRAYTIKNVPLLVVHSQEGSFYAVYDRCPHQHVPLSEGVLCGVTSATQPGDAFEVLREAEIIRCPWHGFSFDLSSGQCMVSAERLRVKTFPLTIERQELFVDI
jgi:nitrite reductase (NADH) small subunit